MIQKIDLHDSEGVKNVNFQCLLAFRRPIPHKIMATPPKSKTLPYFFYSYLLEKAFLKMIAILIAYIADKSQKQGSGGQGSWKQMGQGAAPTPYIL